MVDLEGTGINDPVPEHSAIGIQPGSATPIPQYPGGPNTAVIPQNPITPNIIPQKSGETAEAAAPTPSEARGIGYELASKESPIGMPGANEPGAISRKFIEGKIADYGNANEARKLSPDEANKLYPGMPVPFNEPIDPFVANLQYKNVQRWQDMQAWKDRGGPTPGWNFLMGLAGGVLDPLNATLAAVTGGAAAAFPAVGIGAKVASVYGSNLAMNLTSGFISGVQGEREHAAPLAPGEIVGGAALGAAAATGFHFALHAIFNAREKINQLTPEEQTKILKTAVMQDELGVKQDTSSIGAEHNSKIRGETDTGPSTYKLTGVENMADRPYYLGRNENGVVQLDSLGHGLQGTDHAEAMNNLSEKMAKITLSKDAKFLNLDQKMTPLELKELLGPESSKVIPIDKLENGTSLREIIDSMQQKGIEVPSEPGKELELGGKPINPENPVPDLQKIFQEAMQDKGYRGYAYQGRDSQGTPIDNRIHIFPDAMREMLSGQKTIEGQEAELLSHQEINSNPEVTPKVSAEQQTAINEGMKDPSNHVYADPELDKDLHDLRHGPMINGEPDSMDEFTKQIHQEATDMLTKMATEEGPHAKFAADALETLKKQKVTDAQQLDLMKRLAECAGGSA